MVGIRDRAGRCTNCKHRKIKCDLSRPTCSRCKRLLLKCEYSLIQKGDIFVNRTTANPFIPTVDASSIIAGRKSADLTSDPKRKYGMATFETPNKKLVKYTPNSLNPTPEYRMQLLSHFIGLYLPTGRPAPQIGRTPSSWIQQLAHSSLDSSVYNTSLTALCTAHLGKSNGDEVMLLESIRLYAYSLQGLREIIMRKGFKEDSDAILASIVILSTYETFSSQTQRDDGWASHVRGGSQILHLLGPSVHKTAIGQQLSARIRTICVFEAFITRKTSPTEGIQWPCDNSKTQTIGLFDDLLSLMTRVPSIMEAFDTLKSQGKSIINSEYQQTLVDLLRSCSDTNSRLLSWYKRMQSQVHGELYTIVPAIAHNPADDEGLDRVFPLAIHFQSLSFAQLILLYWSTMVLLYRTMGDIRSLLEDADKLLVDLYHVPMSYASTAAITTEQPSIEYPLIISALDSRIVQLVSNICQSVEYCYRLENGTLGLQSAVFPIWTAQQYYASQPSLFREFRWCSEIGNMKGPNSRFAFGVMRLKTTT